MGLQRPARGSPRQVPSRGFPKGSVVRLLSWGTTRGSGGPGGLRLEGAGGLQREALLDLGHQGLETPRCDLPHTVRGDRLPGREAQSLTRLS